MGEAGIAVEALTAPAASPGLRRVLDRLLDSDRALIVAARGAARPASAARGLRWESAAIVESGARGWRGGCGAAIRWRRGSSSARGISPPRSSPASSRPSHGQPVTGAALDSVGAIPDDAALRRPIRQRVEAAGTSFYWAMRLLPAERRDGMYAIYAFCREVDDIADDCAGARAKRAGLAALARRDRGALCRPAAPSRSPARCVDAGRALRSCARAISTAVIDGMEMDAATRHPRARPRDARPLLRPGRRRGRASVGARLRRSERRRRTRSPTRSAAPCSSPTSCATSTRMRSAAGSICRASCSTGTASARRAARGAAPSGAAAVCRDLAAIARGHFDAAERGDGATARAGRCGRRR